MDIRIFTRKNSETLKAAVLKFISKDNGQLSSREFDFPLKYGTTYTIGQSMSCVNGISPSDCLPHISELQAELSISEYTRNSSPFFFLMSKIQNNVSISRTITDKGIGLKPNVQYQVLPMDYIVFKEFVCIIYLDNEEYLDSRNSSTQFSDFILDHSDSDSETFFRGGEFDETIYYTPEESFSGSGTSSKQNGRKNAISKAAQPMNMIKKSTADENRIIENGVHKIDAHKKNASKTRPIVLLTGFTKKESSKFTQIVKKLKGSIATSPVQCTHLVCNRPCRTFKLLAAIHNCNYIVSSSWLDESQKKKTFVEENKHLFNSDVLISHFKIDLNKSVWNRLSPKSIFAGYTFYIMPSISNPADLKAIIKAGGGACRSSPTYTSRMLNDCIVVIYKGDTHSMKKYGASRIVLDEFIYETSLRQTLSWDSQFVVNMGVSIN